MISTSTSTFTPGETRTGGGALDRLVRPFGITAAAIFTGFAGFQTALALGAPWGDHVWGGSFAAQLPVEMRFVSAGAAGVLVGMATVALARAGVIRRLATWRPLTAVTWGIAGYMLLNTAGNLASQSHLEQYVFGRATLVLAVLTAYVAYRGPGVAGSGNAGAPGVVDGGDLPDGT